jgi:hypothetical protein
MRKGILEQIRSIVILPVLTFTTAFAHRILTNRPSN